ncbi:MAG: PD40 domain-containing protein, partial [Acidobacteria bacterium]|nr:PD40 domain-containing protein [Acidobacteriota bacterium]
MPSLVHGLAALTLVACTSAATAATRYDPRLRFQTIRTPHFFIHFHQGEEALAERLAALAEDVRAALPAGLTGAVAGRTHVILVDQRDLSNGWANPFPVDTIEITAVPPVPASTIGNLDDWLRTVFTHEYAHILHLDRSNGWIGGLRKVFGRAPPLFPNLFLPQWQVEGIATHQESAATGRGRIAAGDFRAILDEGARAHRVEPLDRVSGGLIDWPSGGGVYVYGGYFHRFLVERYGEATLIRLADETARIPPYFGFVAFRTVYGRSLGDLWRDFETSSGSRAGPPAPPPGRRLTAHGFLVERPRWDPISGRILYSVRNPHGFPALMAIAPEGGPSRELVSRFLGDQVAVAADALYFDQQEMVRNVTLQSDLYAAPRRGRPLEIGRVRRLTREQRLTDPDVSPDGRTVACIVVQPGGRALATANLNAPPIAPTIIASEPEAVFASPRWAPDGRTIAVERRRLGGPSEIVLVDASTRSTRVLVSSARGRNVTPAWTPEGRTLLFASDRDGGPFNLYAIDLDTADVRRVTSTNAGAQAPDVSPDGRTIVYVGYTVEGYDLFVMPIGREEWTAPG